MPEGGAVRDGVIDCESDEDPVGELCHLDGEKRVKMALIAKRPVKREELPHHFRDVGGASNIAYTKVGIGGVDEEGSGVVAGDVNVPVGICDEPAGERREVSQGLGER
ncbi:unnamed protein product [Cuscuta epithymum]|uniref:Uncharacterized protein n=1 Tax=Cuscuta epithymum TaxID=186058 RepID=A0AAV0E900_9ASTE|nr:unnamed protein product [Cuscuta epithymum]